MGQTCEIREVWDHTIEALLAAPPKIRHLLDSDFGDEGEFDDEFGGDEDGDDSDDERLEDHGNSLNIDKAWHAMHFALTGTAWEGDFPWAFLQVGGAQIGDEDVGYGPARAFTSDEVSAIADALDTLSQADFAARLDLQKLARHSIYPEIWKNADSIEYVVEYYDRVVEFMRAAARKRKGILVYHC
ncbi:MAG: hypothetical protein AMXMBFR47_21740 [Planctomycetota bacterium]